MVKDGKTIGFPTLTSAKIEHFSGIYFYFFGGVFCYNLNNPHNFNMKPQVHGVWKTIFLLNDDNSPFGGGR